MKRIVITGVFASGKTTLIIKLKEKLEKLGKSVLVINEAARECPFVLNKKQNLMSTFWLVMKQIEMEISLENMDYDFILYDRGLPDIIAHTKFTLSEKSKDEQIIYQKLEELGMSSLQRFDHILLSMRSDEFIIQEDGMRVDDVAYQKQLEKIHINYLNKSKIQYVPLQDKNDDRIAQIIPLIL